MMLIEKYSHHIVVKNIEPIILNTIYKFVKVYLQYGYVRKSWNQTVYEPIKSFAYSTKERKEFRFHIAQLEPFINYCSNNNITNYKLVEMPYNEALPLNMPYNDSIVLRDIQVKAVEYLLNRSEYNLKLLSLQTGTGKALKLSAKIKVPGGWSTMGEMHVGKDIIAKDGSTTKVTGVFPQGKLQMYKITFADGRFTECCAEHLWKIYDSNMRPSVVNTLEVLKLISVPDSKVYIDLIDSEDNKNTDLQVDPYVVGALVKNRNIKNIPKKYLHGSYNQRLSLLKGLLGLKVFLGVKFSNKNIDIKFFTTIEQLALDVQYLIRSLGGIVKMRHKSGRYYLSNKAIRLNEEETLKLKIISIEPTTVEEAQCISIDHPDKLFVTNDFIVTHNTITALNACSIINKRLVIVVRPMYIDKWVNDVKFSFKCEPKDICVVTGQKMLMAIITNSLNGHYDHKVIIISNKTFQSYLSMYKELDEGILDLGFDCLPQDLFKILKAGVRLVDEGHQDFHLNFLIDLFTHVEYSINLTATLNSDNGFIKNMHELCYPIKYRFDSGEYNKYVVAKAIFYSFKFYEKIRYNSSLQPQYSHVTFEKSIMRHNNILEKYFDMIEKIAIDELENNYKPGQKMLIFCATIEMCTRLVRYLQNKHSKYTINRYVEDDQYDNLLNGDIVVSTILSSGTAVDIDNLKVVVMTTALSSSVANLQAIGRLRKMKDNTTPTFVYFVCNNIRPHVKYHENKKLLFSNKVLSHKELNYERIL